MEIQTDSKGQKYVQFATYPQVIKRVWITNGEEPYYPDGPTRFIKIARVRESGRLGNAVEFPVLSDGNDETILLGFIAALNNATGSKHS